MSSEEFNVPFDTWPTGHIQATDCTATDNRTQQTKKKYTKQRH